MFSNLTHQDKEAFFSLLDEYFASRPHHASASYSAPPIDSTSHPSRSLPPLRTPAPISPPPTATYHNALSPTTSNSTQGQQTDGAEPDAAQRFISSSIKYGTAGTKSSVGAVAKNKDAMNLLGKVGMGGMVGKANDRLNTPSPGHESGGAEGSKAPAPAVAPKKSGVSGLISTKSFGHVDTSSRMGMLTSMWKDPQKVHAPTVEQPLHPALPHSHTTLPPPTRRVGSGAPQSASPAPPAVEQARALYDYTGTDGGDLSVQAHQVVDIIDKTSTDWWTCVDGNGQQGLVPATYLEQI